jgi:hypothetical protein
MSNPNKELLGNVLADIESDENLIEYIQPDIDSTKDLIPHVPVDMNLTGISEGFISSSNFGPCIAFLLQFTYNGKERCLLSHFSYGFDERGMRLYEILERFLNDIFICLTDHLGIKSIIPNPSEDVSLSNFILLIAGGDIDQSEDIKRAFSLLNLHCNNETIRLFKSPDVLFIYYQLLSRTIILKSVEKDVSEKTEEAIGQFFLE